MVMEQAEQYTWPLYEALIHTFVAAPHFVERVWLTDQIDSQLAEPNCRFLLLIGEPGAGKSAIMAWLASHHPDWLRYFIRRDSQTPLSGGDARSFLFALGHQLAAQRPGLFQPQNLEVVVDQRIDRVEEGGYAAGITIEDLRASPFLQTALKVTQNVGIVVGELQGLSIKRAVIEKRFLELGNLQHLALLDPAQVLLRQNPGEQIVILVDALDELRYQPTQDSILDWLTACPELPPNVRVIVSTRPELLLEAFRRSQHLWLHEVVIEPGSPQVVSDLHRFMEGFVNEKSIQTTLAQHGIEVAVFKEDVVVKADGNFQYVVALTRAIRQELAESDLVEDDLAQSTKAALLQLLLLHDVPRGLNELYHFFVSRIRLSVAGQEITVAGVVASQDRRIPLWEGVYQPILGLLSVAREPLSVGQVASYGGMEAERRWLQSALLRLRQFLDQHGDSYRLYHSTMAEYITSQRTLASYPDDYLDPAEWHSKIVRFYRGTYPSWEEVDWNQIDNYGLHYLATHLYALSDNEVYRQELYNLICQPFMREKQKRTYSYRAFAEDVLLTIQVASTEGLAGLMYVIRGSLIYATLSSISSNVPPTVLEALARNGEVEKALGYANLVLDKTQQFQAYQLIGAVLLEQKGEEEAKEVLLRGLAAAGSIEDNEYRNRALSMINHILIRGSNGDPKKTLTRKKDLRMNHLDECQVLSIALTRDGGEKILNQTLTKVDWLQRESEKADILSKIALALSLVAQKEGIKKALSLINTVKNVGIEAEVLCELAQILARVGEFRLALVAAESIADKDAARAQVMSTIDPEFAGYYAMDLGFALMHLEVRLFSLKEKALASVVDALAEAAETQQLNQALIAAETLGNNAVKVLKRVAYALIEIGEQGVQLQILKVGPVEEEKVERINFVEALSSIAQGFAQIGEIDRANQIISKIEEVEMKAQVLREVVSAFITANKFEQATAAAEAIENDHIRSNALIEEAHALAQAGNKEQLDRVLIAAKAIRDERPRAEALTGVALSLARVRDLEMLKRVLAAVNEFEVESTKAEALGGVTQILAQVKDREGLDQALAITEVIQDEWAKAEALIGIAQALARVDDHEGLRQALSIALAIKNENCRSKGINGVARALAQVGDKEGLRQALEKAISIKDEWARAEVLGGPRIIISYPDTSLIHNLYISEEVRGGIARALAQVGDKEGLRQALAAAIAIKDEKNRSEALVGSVLAMTVAWDKELLDEVLAYTNQIKNESGKAEVLIGITNVLAQATDNEGMNRVLTMAESIEEDVYARAKLLGSIAKAQAETGNREGLNRTLTIVETSYTYEAAKADAVIGVVQALAQIGDVEGVKRALIAANSIWNELQRVQALSEVARALILVGEKMAAVDAANHALNLAREIKYGDKDRALSLVAHTLSFVKDSDILSLALKAAESIDGIGSTVVDPLKEVVKALAQMKDKELLKKSLVVTEAIQDQWTFIHVLGEVVEAFVQVGEDERALSFWISAFVRLRSSSREHVLDALRRCASFIAGIDHGQTLWNVYKITMEVDAWWHTR